MTVHRWWTAVAMTVCPRVALACGEDGDDRIVRRYSDCMAYSNTTLHRRMVSNAVWSVPLSAEAIEERLRTQLERGEATMAGIRIDYARYCE